jgi:ribosomal protein S12 methylthiotransferase accessory factor YcaO
VIPARYSLIRYVPDAARGEELNVGIVAWTERHLALEVDQRAVERVLRENPHLAKDALLGLRDRLREELTASAPDPALAAATWLSSQRGYPVIATEDRHTTVIEDSSEALTEAVDRLLARIVRPRRRGGGGFNPGHALERSLRPLLQSQRVVRDYTFSTSRSGVPRRVDYFANSGANIALDLVKLAVTRTDELLRRADAEAFKVEDIRGSNDIDVVVFCAISSDDAVRDATANAEQIIGSVGARVVTSVEDAAGALVGAVG